MLYFRKNFIMKIYTSVEDFQKFRETESVISKIGFVPTMGALHEGHLALVKRSVSENELTIVSIFVNPKQFNDKSDFNNYPVTISEDLEMLKKVHCDVVFMPNADDIYKDYFGYKIDFDGLDEIYEGEFRPGHFQGVVDIVYRLFDIVKPNNSYFGEKDFQQLAIIKLMVKRAEMSVNVVPCKIVREESGLAMSSRNQRLSVTQRISAAKIYQILNEVTLKISSKNNPEDISVYIENEINKVEDLKTEYVVFCDPDSLVKVEEFVENSEVRLCLAVWCGKIRLIDNISLQF